MKVTVDELASSMGKIIPTAKNLGVNVEQLGAGYAIMTAKGIASAEATTYMNSMFNELGKSGSKTDTILKKIANKSFKQLSEEGKSTGDILAMLEKHAKDNNLALSDLFGSAEAGKAAMTLLSEGAEGYNEKLESMKNSVGATDDAFNAMNNTAKEKLTQSLAVLKNSLSDVGDSLRPLVGIIADLITKFATWMSDMAKNHPVLVNVTMGILGILAVVGPLLLVIGKLVTAFAAIGVAGTTLLTGLAVVGGAVALLGTAFVGLNENASNALLDLPNKATTAINGFLQKVVDSLPQILNKGMEMMFKFTEGVALGIPILFEFLTTSIMNLLSTLFELGPQFLNTGLEFVQKMLDGAIQKFPEFIGKTMDGILNVLENIRGKLPEFLKAGVEFVGKMAEGLWSNLPTIIYKVGELLAKVIGKIVEYLPMFLAEGVKIVGEIAIGLWNNKGAILKAIGDVIMVAWNAAAEAIKAFVNIGASIVSNIKQGIANAWGSLVNWITGKLKSIPLIGKLFKMQPPPVEEDLTQDIVSNNLTRVKFDYSNVRALKNGQIASDLVGLSTFMGLDSLKKDKKSKEIIKKGDININVNVDKMMNSDNRSIEEIADELAFCIKRKNIF